MDLSEVFKYQRVKGNLTEAIEKETVTACCLEENAIIIGTLRGLVYIFSLAGKIIKRYPAHDGAVNDISVDNNGLVIYSCGECGNVVTNSLAIEGEEKETVLFVDESLKVLCTEDSTPGRKEKSSFVVGTALGRLILHRPSWFAKDVELFNGSGSGVTAVAWRGDVVAWADASQVRLVDVNAQVAICYLNSPANVGPSNPFPCKLFWESEYDLLIGWADNIRHLQLVYTSLAAADTPSQLTPGGHATSGDADIRARLIADWDMDTTVCGVSSFDEDHLLVLGHMPPDDAASDNADSEHSETKDEDVDQESAVVSNGPEILLMRRTDGHIVSADILPLATSGDITPCTFRLLSNYTCYSRRSDYLKWSILAPSSRGGYRGFPPVVYVISSHDIVMSRVRDVNDRITSALQRGDLLSAVDLAHSDRNVLRIYQYHDLVKAYINSLFNMDNAELAAKECARLIQNDSDGAALWEAWIFEFANRKRLSCIAPYVPIDNPRLPNSVYEVMLSNFLFVNTQAFLASIRKWGGTKPPLFDAASLLKRVIVTMDSKQKDRAGPVDPWLLEAKAYLHTILQQYQAAVQCYLEIVPTNDEDSSSFSVGSDHEQKGGDYQYVFDLIEKQNLFENIQDQVVRLVKLSPKLAEGLLIRNIEKLPVFTVVKQLRDDAPLLYWYLHALFTHAPDMYNSQEYADLHLKQVSLYAHFAHNKQMKTDKATAGDDRSNQSARGDMDNKLQVAFVAPTANSPSDSSSAHEAMIKSPSGPAKPGGLTVTHAGNPRRPLITARDMRGRTNEDSDFLKFLKYSNFVSLEVALRECERQQPPLYHEIIYILARMGNIKEGLAMLLRELGDVNLAVEYVERYDVSLWSDVVDYGLTHHDFLADLMDLIGLYNKFDPMTLIEKLPPCMSIPDLRLKLLRLLQHCSFQEFLQNQNRMILQDDTLTLLRQLNRGQRKGVKLSTGPSRCAGCGRPISIPPPAQLLTDYDEALSTSGGLSLPSASNRSQPVVPIWGLPSSCGIQPQQQTSTAGSATRSTLVVFLPNKVAYHRICFDMKSEMEKTISSRASNSRKI